MKGRLDYLKYAIYSIIVLIFTLVRVDALSEEGMTLTYIFRYNHIFDVCLLLSVIGYFYHRFYNSVYVKTRLDRNGEKEHFKGVFKEFIILLSLWCSILILYDFKDITLKNISGVVSIYLMIISSNLLFLIVHFHLVRRMKYYMVFGIELLALSAYRFYLQGMMDVGNYNIFSSSMKQNYMIIAANLILVTAGSYALWKKEKPSGKGILRKINQDYIIYVIAEIFSTYYLASSLQKRYSYSFYDHFFLTSTEKFTGFIFWLLPKMVILFVGYRTITRTYHHNLIFHLVRIDDRSRWVGRLIGKNIRYALVFTLIKSVIIAVIYGWHIKIIESGVGYMFLTLLMMLATNIIYLLLKKDEVLNYLLIGYLITATIAVYGGVRFLAWMMLDIRKWTNALMLAGCIALYVITVFMLKRDEYYV